MENLLVLAAGTPLFKGIEDRLGLNLLEAKTFRNGNAAF